MSEQETWNGDDVIRNLIRNGQLSGDPGLMKLYGIHPPRDQTQKNRDKRRRRKQRGVKQ